MASTEHLDLPEYIPARARAERSPAHARRIPIDATETEARKAAMLEFLRNPPEENMRRFTYESSWHLRVMRFLFGKWFRMREWDVKKEIQ